MTAPQILEALRVITSPQALSADVEDELEELGLIVQDHRPYATLTAKGERLLTGGTV